ncbi:MAG: hypothetical protein HQM02_06385 [Magnetococcales bacterium]|nr:hypothetical protein [Magnetococcales bacterium]
MNVLENDMDGTDFFLFFWIGMALIKWVILIFTFFDTVVAYENSKNSEISIDGLWLGCMVSGLVTTVPALILWPLLLMEQKSKFFMFPDMNARVYLLRYLEKDTP